MRIRVPQTQIGGGGSIGYYDYTRRFAGKLWCEILKEIFVRGNKINASWCNRGKMRTRWVLRDKRVAQYIFCDM